MDIKKKTTFTKFTNYDNYEEICTRFSSAPIALWADLLASSLLDGLCDFWHLVLPTPSSSLGLKSRIG